MIRLFTIFCKLNQITLSDRQWFEQDVKGICPMDCACPFCGSAGCMDFFACYDRYLVEMERKRISPGWLSIVARFIYNCGGRIDPCPEN